MSSERDRLEREIEADIKAIKQLRMRKRALMERNVDDMWGISLMKMSYVPIRYTRNLFLRAFCAVYLSVFLSLYFQAPGLYGDNGILPARSLLENSKHKTMSAKIHYQPTLLWLAPFLGLSTSAAIDVLSLLGVFLAFTGIVSQKFCIAPVFAALWSLFFSLYQIGQVFRTKGYDELLLEAGFLAILMAPLLPFQWKRHHKVPGSDVIVFFLCRWLLLRFLFNTAVGKLLSGCPKWWSLSALNYHFETMPLPNPMSWYVHHLPTWFLRLSTVYAHACELVVPFLFLLPIRSTRITAFHLQLFLQTCIVATGNFGFSNILTVTLLLTLLDDQFFYGKKKPNTSGDLFHKIVNVGIWIFVGYIVTRIYGITYKNGILEADIAFSKTQFHERLPIILPTLMILSYVFVLVFIYTACMNTFFYGTIDAQHYYEMMGVMVCAFTGVALVLGASANILSIHPKMNATITPLMRLPYARAQKIRILNNYDLFPKMTGVEGRPEIIFEGSDNLEGPWKEYNFLYKPGNVNHSLPFVAPYSPKLDWQLYWAAQSTYDKNPWLLSLTHRLLTGQPEVLNLIDRAHSPFADRPPKYIRGVLYKYKYTSWSHRSQPAWWIREKVGEYFPPYTKDSPALEDFLKARNLLPSSKPEELNPIWKLVLDAIRFVANKFEATLLFWSVFSAALTIVATTSMS